MVTEAASPNLVLSQAPMPDLGTLMVGKPFVHVGFWLFNTRTTIVFVPIGSLPCFWKYLSVHPVWVMHSNWLAAIHAGQRQSHKVICIQWVIGPQWGRSETAWSIFRWFKFTLKPPYSGAHERSLLAIWDTSHWNFFVKFGLKTAWDISYDILLSLLKFVNFWRLQGHLSILAKIGCLQKIKVFSMKEWRGFDVTWGVLGSQITRLYDGTIFGGVQHT